jgi:putative FmdB family regulatory protein
MPTYEYRCTDCGKDLEAVQSFHDDPLTVCPSCQGKLRKVFSPIGIAFKGSGFYRTDNRSSSSVPAGKGSSGDSSSKTAVNVTGSDIVWLLTITGVRPITGATPVMHDRHDVDVVVLRRSGRYLKPGAEPGTGSSGRPSSCTRRAPGT